MRCPYCRFRDSKVTDSRANDDGIRRRRQCIACGERFSTLETVPLATVQIIKKDGRREDFNRDKLLAGMRRACTKRNVSVAQLEAVVTDIEARVITDGRPEIPSSVVGELAMDALRALDHIAYIRFASVYRPFTDIESLKELVAQLEDGHNASLEEQSLQLPFPADGDGPPSIRPLFLGDVESRRIAEPAV